MRAAFIIGCSEYDDPDIANLSFAHRDASDFANVIEQNCGFTSEQITVLASDQSERHLWPTKSNIIRALRPRLEIRRRFSTIFFFFSGHGFHSSRNGRDYLIPQDAAVNELEDSSIAFDKVLEYLQTWNANTVVLFLDACRAVTGGGKAVAIEEWETLDVGSLHSYGMASLCSCSPFQRSYESEDLKRGIFTSGLCEALTERGKCRTLYELDTYLGKRIPQISKETGKPAQVPYTRIEPVSILQMQVVSDHRVNEWRSTLALGSELRKNQVPPCSNLMANPEKLICAIDFGTSYSTVGLLDTSGKAALVPSPTGRFLVPSVVSFFNNGDYAVGWDAVENSKINLKNTVFSAKRFLGTKTVFNINGKSLTPELISSLVIRSLKRNAEEYVQRTISTALVSAPANFDIVQTNALVSAFQEAGLNVFRVIGEPCASSIAFYSEFRTEDQHDHVVVIDLGGGTFDVSIMELEYGVCETKAIAGDNNLGGIDYDTAILKWLIPTVKNCIQDHTYELSDLDIAQLGVECERVKVALGTSLETLVVVQNLEVGDRGLINFSVPMSRDLFRELTSDLNLRVERCISHALKLAGLTPDKCDFVFLAGQGSKIFTIREMLERLFPDKPLINRFQELAVIRGLSEYCGVFYGLKKDLLLLDSNYCAIGVKCRESSLVEGHVNTVKDPRMNIVVSGNKEENIVAVHLLALGTTIPTISHCTCKVTDAGDSKIVLEIIEFDTFGALTSQLVGTIDLEITSGSEFIISIEVDANRTIVLSVSDLSTKKIHRHQLNNLFHEGRAFTRPRVAEDFEVLPLQRVNEVQDREIPLNKNQV